MRSTRNVLGVAGWILAIAGGLISGLYSSDNAACGSSVGVAARSLNQTAQSSCVLYGTLVTLGIVVAAIGLILLAGWVALLVRLSGAGEAEAAPGARAAATGKAPTVTRDPASAPAGWYKVGHQDGPLGYWDGQRWTRVENE